MSVFRVCLCSGHNFGPFSAEILVNLVHEGLSDKIVVVFFHRVGLLDQNGQILGHVPLQHAIDDSLFESLREQSQLFVAVKFGTVLQTTSPSEDRGNRVGRG